MTSPDGPTPAPARSDLEALRQALVELRRQVGTTLDDLDARLEALLAASAADAPAYSRPVAVPLVRMEQMARAPEPTADLDDLVDVLAPRLLDQLLPALRATLRDEA